MHCWGHNDENGKLEPPKNEFFVQVVSGQFFSCGINIEQRVECWGQIDVGTSSKEIPGLYTQLTASRFAVCGVMTDGRIHCWGHSAAILGARTLQAEAVRPFVQLSCSEDHCCALNDEGVVRCAGRGRAGSGRGLELRAPEQRQVLDPRGQPVDVAVLAGLGAQEVVAEGLVLLSAPVLFAQVSVGPEFSCGIRALDRALQCWGASSVHRMHQEAEQEAGVPGLFDGEVRIVVEGPFRQVSVGRVGVCAIEQEGALRCWGHVEVPRDVLSGPLRWDQVSVGFLGACASTEDEAAVHCWGGAAAVSEHVPDIELA